MAEENTQPKIIDVVAPTVSKHAATMTVQATTEPKTVETTPSVGTVSNTGFSIAPPSEGSDVTTVPQAAKEPPPSQETSEPIKSTTVSTVDEPTVSTRTTSPYEASDSLPDMSQKMTTEMTNDMQSPRIYDTKEYIVPIHDTMHGHGLFGKIMAGIISAAVVLGIVFAAAYWLA